MSDDLIFGLHAVLEAIDGPARRVTSVVILEGRQDRRIGELIAAARREGVPVSRAPRKALDRMAAGGIHQGVVATITRIAFEDPDAVLTRAADPPLFVVLDGVDDPRNLGAAIRSAAGAGADGLFLPARGTPGLTAACVKASAGAVERIPVARIPNVVAFLKSLKKKGIWVVGLDPAGGEAYDRFDLTQPIAVVLGSEGKGLRRLARETCDILLRIPLRSGLESLNLAVAAGVILFEAGRQRRARSGVTLSTHRAAAGGESDLAP